MIFLNSAVSITKSSKVLSRSSNLLSVPGAMVLLSIHPTPSAPLTWTTAQLRSPKFLVSPSTLDCLGLFIRCINWIIGGYLPRGTSMPKQWGTGKLAKQELHKRQPCCAVNSGTEAGRPGEGGGEVRPRGWVCWLLTPAGKGCVRIQSFKSTQRRTSANVAASSIR